jgi:hypothetical protein
MIVPFSKLLNKTITDIEISKWKTSMRLVCSDGYIYVIEHEQDCCEDVHLEDICGDLEDLIGSPILLAEESTSDKDPLPDYEYFQWTFYTLRTIKGTVTLRWWGNSNGYYSIDVDVNETISQELRDAAFGDALVKIQESIDKGEGIVFFDYKDYLLQDFHRNYYHTIYKIDYSEQDNWISITFNK